MTSLSVIFIIIIILTSLYLIMNYTKYQKVMESFDNINTSQSTQSSLSTYFQNNVDKDLLHRTNIYNNPTISPMQKNNGWTGIWRTLDDPNFNSAFVQNNDKLLISFSNNSLNDVFSKIISSEDLSELYTIGLKNISCPNNLFLGVGQLNKNRNIFNLTKIICNTYSNNSLNLAVNQLSGSLSDDKKTIQLFPDGKNNMTLYKYYIYNVQENNIVNGNDLKDGTITNTTLDQCKFLCNNNNDCKGFSFQKSNNSCYLKSNTLEKSTNNDYNTYTKEPKLINGLENSSNYLNKISPFVNNYPEIPYNEMLYQEQYCTGNSKPCYDKSNGIALTSYSGMKYNACGTPTSSIDNTCVGTPSCMITDQNINGIPKCNKTYILNDYMNSNAFGEISKKTGSTLNICEAIKHIKKCNSFIICYVNNLGNVYTLNYQFFGSLPEESNLTLQVDIMNELLNNTNNKIALLPFYRNIIKNSNTVNPDNELKTKNIINALSFTNCLENNNYESTTANRISSSIQCATKYINNYVPINGNNNLKPALWNLESGSNYINSCSIRLSTSSKYNTPVKYAKYNGDGSTSLSLFSGGNNEELIMENATIIQNIDYSNTSYIAITTNLKANNQLYLMPSSSTTGFSNNSELVSLTQKPSENGKWLLLGFNINNISELEFTLKKIRFNYNI